MAVLAVIAVTAVVSISIAGGGEDNQQASSHGDEASEYASADDTGPVNIITEDPTCAAWMPVNNTVAQVQKNGWDERDAAIPASAWTLEERAQYEEVGRALGSAAEQTVALLKSTPHRVIRELFETFIIYSKAYIESFPTYTADDDALMGVAAAASSTLVNICTAIRYGSAEARVILVDSTAPPSVISPTTPYLSSLEQFIDVDDPVCVQWESLVRQFDAETAAWQDLNSDIPASEWTAEQRSVVDAVIPVMNEYADKFEELGRTSPNGRIQDFAVLAAQYRRAYVASLPSYTAADSYLTAASARAAWVVVEACECAGE